MVVSQANLQVSALRATLKSKDLEMRQKSSEAGLLQQSLEDHGKRQQKHESKMREAERQVSALRSEWLLVVSLPSLPKLSQSQ